MSKLANVVLRSREGDRVAAGHPWIYQRAIEKEPANVPDGAVVQVKDHKNRFLGIGIYNSQSRIRVRMFNRTRRSLDREFFEERVSAALELRERHLPDCRSCRLINSESDFLSGLIVDRYDDHLVIQVTSLALDQHLEDIVSVLDERLSPASIIERSDVAARKFEGLPESNRVLKGEMPGVIEIDLNGLKFSVDLQGGHKTGAYLDQQANYQAVADAIARYPQPKVLDCFTFQGGFALHAARVEGASVTAIDQSEEAIKQARENAKNNGLNNCEFVNGNAFDWLKSKSAKNEAEKNQFDCIILDPPSFTRNRKSVGDALRGYKEIHVRALKLLKPGGLLASFCCSHHVDAELFQSVILDSAYDTRRTLRRIASYSQSPDHPVIPAIPETEYLKGFAFEAL